MVFLTKQGEIIKFPFDDAEPVNQTKMITILECHYDGETWGLDIKDGIIYSTGDDNLLMEWDIAKHTLMRATPLLTDSEMKTYAKVVDKLAVKSITAATYSSFPPEQCARAIAVSSLNKHAAIGFLDGKILIRKLEKKTYGTMKKIMHDPKEWCEVIKYSPDESLLACGSHDNKIYIYDVKKDYEL